MFDFAPEADVIILEGFSQTVLNDNHVGKILCVNNKEEIEEFKGEAKGTIIAFYSVQPMKKPVVNIEEEPDILVKRTLRYIRRERKISEILNRLPRLNCGKCRRSSCEEMAIAIYKGKAKLKDCITLRLQSKLKTNITINDVEIPLQPFVSEIIRRSLLGMASALKGISIKGNEEIHIRILS